MNAISRKILADSHIAAIAIAVLLAWSLNFAAWALWTPLSRVISFVLTAIAILDIPYFSREFTLADRAMLLSTFSNSVERL